MDKVQTSCTSHLKHLQAMHGEELATIYAEMTQARSAAEELFAQKEEATAKIERLQQRRGALAERLGQRHAACLAQCILSKMECLQLRRGVVPACR